MSTLIQKLRQAGNRPVVFLTGAGISAESNIPTFRGEEGYWTVGSKHYHPTELATRQAFSELPMDVWAWYLFRRTVCRRAEPNPGHLLLARLEEHMGDRFLLVTQNVEEFEFYVGEDLILPHGNM